MHLRPDKCSGCCPFWSYHRAIFYTMPINSKPETVVSNRLIYGDKLISLQATVYHGFMWAFDDIFLPTTAYFCKLLRSESVIDFQASWYFIYSIQSLKPPRPILLYRAIGISTFFFKWILGKYQKKSKWEEEEEEVEKECVCKVNKNMPNK